MRTAVTPLSSNAHPPRGRLPLTLAPSDGVSNEPNGAARFSAPAGVTTRETFPARSRNFTYGTPPDHVREASSGSHTVPANDDEGLTAMSATPLKSSEADRF